MPTDAVPEDQRVALIAIRQIAGELLEAHRRGEELYEVLPLELKEAVDRRPDSDYRAELIVFLGTSPPEYRRQRRKVLVNAIATLDAVLNGQGAGMERADVDLLLQATAALHLMSTAAKREAARFFDGVNAREDIEVRLRSSGRGRIAAQLVRNQP